MRWILLAAVLGLLNLPANSESVELWSGRENVLPGTGKWELVAEHGRVLGSGTGEARLAIPPLADGATLTAVLKREGKTQKLHFHSPKPLVGIYAGMFELPHGKEKLWQQYGLPEATKRLPDIWFCGSFPPRTAGRLFLFFPGKRDFPLFTGKDWDEISLKHAKISGSLSVLYDKKEQMFELNGPFSYAVLKKDGKTVIVFAPELDFDQIENVLLIKKLVKENEK